MTTALTVRLFVAFWLIITGWTIYRANTVSARYYWLAAALIYVGSVPFAMSIGGITVAGAFACAGAALAHVVSPASGARGRAIGAALALVVWAGWFLLGDITWVFWPLFGPVALLFGR